MSTRTPRQNLRRERRRHGWSVEKAVEQVLLKAAEKGIPPEVLDIDDRQLGRWESGATEPRRFNIWLLSETYEVPPEQLDLPPIPGVALAHAASHADTGKIPDVERRDFLKRAAGLGLIGLSSDQVARLVMGVAHESRAHVANVELSNVGPATLEQLASDVARLSRALVSEPPVPVFAELVGTRDSIYARLEGRQFPAQTADLHLLAGQTCGLLANVSLDLGYNAAAAEQARSTWAYGEVIGHNALRAFGRAAQSLVAYWSGAYGDAVRFAQAGQVFIGSPNGRARLMALEARALAKLGNAKEVSALVAQASEAIEHADSWASPGGHLAFTKAKLNYYAANALADLGRCDDAVAHGERSIQLYQVTPSNLRSYGDEAGCYIALAEVSLRQGAIDGASARLAPVLSHPHARHIQPLRNMLGGLRAQLANPPLRSADARALMERLDSF